MSRHAAGHAPHVYIYIYQCLFDVDRSPIDFDSIRSTEVTELLKVLAAAKVPQQEIHNYFQHFTWPSWVGARGVDAKKVLEKKNDTFKSSASEALGMYPVLAEFLHDLPADRSRELHLAIQSFQALRRVLDLLVLCSKKGRVRSSELAEAIRGHLQAFKLAYGEALLPPKAHYSMHLPLILDHWGLLLSCFVHERKHREVKRFLNNVQTGRSSDKSVTEDVLLSHYWELKEGVPSLPDQKPCSSRLAEAFCTAYKVALVPMLTSSSLSIRGMRCSSGDVVLADWGKGSHVCRVHCHVSRENVPYTLVTVADEQFFIESSAIDCCCIHGSPAGRFKALPVRRC